MTVIACSGFPVPVSRYWREFAGVEISETELGIPGAGTIRRWLRESPDDFLFTLLAPKEVAASGFKPDAAAEKMLKELGTLCRSMKAQAIVFTAPPDFPLTRPRKSAVKAFLKSLPARYPRIVLDLPEWNPEDVQALVAERKHAVAAYDPLTREVAPTKNDFEYMRLPGPAGHRSRYDEASMARLAEHCKSLKSKFPVCVFHNIDMHANARQIRELLKQL
jgi:uncharacterized protein YecE (DUF72 family)